MGMFTCTDVKAILMLFLMLNAEQQNGIDDVLSNCKAILTAEELEEKTYKELYGGGTSDETTSSSEVL